ncbi:sensor histidine kinase [Olivibacter sp. CPCC 100613]|uniref:sensor histidine kinase n=1 Tax=Olivibacter sp. CPCC 100613 TaxID=3079931 RepID=UPI002FF4E0D5
MSRLLFGNDVFSPPTVLYGIIVTLVTIGNHYFFVSKTLPQLNKGRWFQVVLHLFLLYIFSVVFTVKPLKWLTILFPDNPFFETQSQRYQLSSPFDIFTYKAFIWVYTVVVLNNTITFSLKLVLNYFTSMREKMLLLEEKNKMELNFLRSQIQPHFLFNTLNNIYGEVIDNERASQSILKLADLLRFSLYDSMKGAITLKDEIKFLTDYISLEKMRHKESKVAIRYDFAAVEHPDLKVTPLILVNFVENAFKHGVNASIASSWVNIVLKEEDHVVTFSVSNSLDSSSHQRRAGGLGLVNVKRRLDLEYQEYYDLSLKEAADHYDVVLTLKLKNDQNNYNLH